MTSAAVLQFTAFANILPLAVSLLNLFLTATQTITTAVILFDFGAIPIYGNF